MTFRELGMIDVKEALRRWSAGHGMRSIGRGAGIDRKTVKRYVAAAEQLGFKAGSELTEDEIHRVAQVVQARPAGETSEEWQAIAAHHDRIARWLAGGDGVRPLRLTKVHALLVRDHELAASYDTLWRYARQQLAWRQKRSTVRLADPEPGQEVQLDFGEMGRIVEDASGRRRKLWVLVITLCFSRYQFVWPTFEQTTEAVCEGLDRAWMFFGGIAASLIPDNTKAMVKEVDALSPTLVAAFLDYVQARDLFVDAARVRSPKDKARVENQVAYVRESWFDGETFTSIDDARESARRWCSDVAGTRVHGTTCKVPREVFESVEKPLMRPPPTQVYDVPRWFDKLKVHPDHHIQALHALYSVPHLYLHKKVRARVDRQLVKIYLGTQLIKTHARQPEGGRATDPADYPSQKAIYASRDINALAAEAKKHGAHVGTFAERLLDGPLPWTRMRQAYALLSLCTKFGSGRVEAICQTALAFDIVDVPRIAKMLRKAVPPQRDEQRGKLVHLSPPKFMRPTDQFETRSKSRGEDA